MNELKIAQNNGTIEFNFEELKADLEKQLAAYTGLVLTEKTVKEGKKSVAELNALKKDINDRRIEVKKEHMKPYDEFEKKAKELGELIDKPIFLIKDQLEAFEQRRIEERKQEISAIYEESIADLKEILPLSRIYNSKWENATTTKKAIKDDIKTKVLNTQNDLKIIKEMPTDATEKAIETYKATLQLSDAITYINRYEQQKADILKRQEEERKRAEEEAQKAAEQKPEVPGVENASESVSKQEVFIPPTTEPDYATSYEVVADPFQLVQLESFMREHGITYRRI